jgi:hypothetical protein
MQEIWTVVIAILLASAMGACSKLQCSRPVAEILQDRTGNELRSVGVHAALPYGRRQANASTAWAGASNGRWELVTASAPAGRMSFGAQKRVSGIPSGKQGLCGEY